MKSRTPPKKVCHKEPYGVKISVQTKFLQGGIMLSIFLGVCESNLIGVAFFVTQAIVF